MRLVKKATPASVTPRLGTEPAAEFAQQANENVTVPTNMASTSFCSRSRYHSRMNLGDNVPVAICTTSTLIVTTKPNRPTIAAMIAVSTPLAVSAE